MFQINLFEIEAQVLQFMDDLGITPYDKNIIIDGQLHRYRTADDKKSEKSGAYCIYPDNLPAGFVQDWRKGIKSDWAFKTDNLSQEQINYFNSPEVKAHSEKIKKERQKKREQEAIEASEKARILWEQSKPANETHPYLQRKKVRNYGLHVDSENNLLVPLCDIKGKFKTLQRIPADKNETKKFFLGAPFTGAFWSIAFDTLNQDKNSPILIGEGYATMAKVYELTNMPCVAAMNCYALKIIAGLIKKEYKDRKIIILADNDANTQNKTGKNPGLDHAYEACNSLKLNGVLHPTFLSPEEGTDWDDYALRYGNEATANFLKKNIQWLCLSEKEKSKIQKREKLSTLVNNLDPTIQIKPQEFIGGMYPRKFVSAIVAPSGTGKTMYMQKNVSDLSIGGSIFDGFAEDEPPRKCLIFAGEAGYELLIRRGASTKWAINPKNVQVVDQYKFESNNISVSLDNQEGWENITELVDIYKPDIVFFDTYSSFHDKDENKATEMKPIIKKLADLARDFNMAVVLIHHSRKRTAKERTLSLNQDDVIGSSVFNRLVGLIIGIEPMKEDEKTLLVRTLKTWFSAFMPFTYKISEDANGRTIVQTDLAPASVNNSKLAVWNYLVKNFNPDDWFSISNIVLSEIEPTVSVWQVKRILADFVKNNKLKKRGAARYTEYSVISFYE